MATIAARLAHDRPETNAEVGFGFFRQRDEMSPRYRTLLLALCGASLCLLLLTCASLANLFLARAASRERELAVRAALGAGRERLMRQMLTDSAVLALAGGAAGALVAAMAVPLLASLVPPTLPIAAQPSLDWRVLGFAAAFSAHGSGVWPHSRAACRRAHRFYRATRGRARRSENATAHGPGGDRGGCFRGARCLR